MTGHQAEDSISVKCDKCAHWTRVRVRCAVEITGVKLRTSFVNDELKHPKARGLVFDGQTNTTNPEASK